MQESMSGPGTSGRMFQDLTIVDFHAHFRAGQDRTRPQPDPHDDTARIRAEQAAEYRRRWRLAFDFPEPDPAERTWEEESDLWVAELEKYGISRIGFVTGGGNDQLGKVVARHPDDLIGFAHHSPFSPGAADELDRAVTELGLRGYKMLAPTLEKRIDDRSAYPCWEVAARHRIPVLIHFGMLGAGGGIAFNDKINPAYLEQVAKDFPTLDFVIPHFGIQFVKELLFLCWACPNVHVDSSGSNQWIQWMPYRLTLEDLFRKFYETVGPERIVFGSDSSWFPRGFAIRYLQDQVRICRLMGMPDEHLRLIFGGNATRLLQLQS